MGKVRFRGGISRQDGKDRTKEKPITVLYPKADTIYPLSQHIGLPAKPIVEVGDSVLVGQRIAEAAGVVSAHILSSVSGRVKAVWWKTGRMPPDKRGAQSVHPGNCPD